MSWHPSTSGIALAAVAPRSQRIGVAGTYRRTAGCVAATIGGSDSRGAGAPYGKSGTNEQLIAATRPPRAPAERSMNAFRCPVSSVRASIGPGGATWVHLHREASVPVCSPESSWSRQAVGVGDVGRAGAAQGQAEAAQRGRPVRRVVPRVRKPPDVRVRAVSHHERDAARRDRFLRRGHQQQRGHHRTHEHPPKPTTLPPTVARSGLGRSGSGPIRTLASHPSHPSLLRGLARGSVFSPRGRQHRRGNRQLPSVARSARTVVPKARFEATTESGRSSKRL